MLKLIIFQLTLYLSHTYTTAQPKFISRVCQDTFGNYTANSPFKKNLDTLLSTIVSNTNIDYGFYNFSVGTNLDIVNGIGLCSPELPVHDCRSCLSNAARAIVHSCPNQKDAIGWYDSCMIRYSNRYIFHKLEFGPWYKVHYPILRSIDKGLYNKTASTLLTKLQARAAFGNSLRKFAADKANVTSDFTVYAIVQCTPDLESFDCYSCLGHAIATYYQQEGQQARLFFTSCNIRLFHDYMLYDLSSLNSLLPQTQGKASKKWRVFVEILLPIIASLLILAAIFGCYFSRKRSKLKNRIKHM
ncbi:Cysteine-rich receptor-like protein kinase 26, partial [Bienertia sinuspersici]